MAFQYLSDARLQELVDALVQADRIDAGSRRLLLAHVNRTYAATLPVLNAPRDQVLSDLTAMNRIARLADGSVPLERWLQAAVNLTDVLEEGKVFRAALDDVKTLSTARPSVDVVDPASGDRRADPVKLPESKERIVHQNDMVPYGFLAQGHAAGASVARLRVPRYENGRPFSRNGNPVLYLGTGWLIGPKLLVTNHHVINARDGGEPLASAQDFARQGESTEVQFDYDGSNAAGTTVSAVGVVSSDPALDYAILELSADPGRPALRLRPEPLSIDARSYIPVNIIQHPGGEPKQVAVRNNLVTAAAPTELRYFTDTMPGSSGSPVLDDLWRVVALHRASTSVEGVKYQGRDTAWVNVGTPIGAILQHLTTHAAPVRARIVV